VRVSRALDDLGALPAFAKVLCVAALVPVSCALCFWTFVLRARIILGRWPRPNRPDPNDLGLAVHYHLAFLAIFLLPVVPLAVMAVAALRYRSLREEGVQPRWVVVIALLVLAATLLWTRNDPGRYLEWFID
jgi:hypothetical protein